MCRGRPTGFPVSFPEPVSAREQEASVCARFGAPGPGLFLPHTVATAAHPTGEAQAPAPLDGVAAWEGLELHVEHFHLGITHTVPLGTVFVLIAIRCFIINQSIDFFLQMRVGKSHVGCPPTCAP